MQLLSRAVTLTFGNVNVNYKPCKSVTQLKAAEKYMLSQMPEQQRNGIVKTRDELYSALDCNRNNFANSILVTRKLNGKSYSRIKDKTILAHKLSISFHPDDNISYDKAMKIAEGFADNFIASQGYEILYAVHIDKEHTHVHVLVSNCNMDTGKCFHRNQSAPDSMLSFEIDGYIFTRRSCDEIRVSENEIISKWSPFKGIDVVTTLIPIENGHIRKHTITSEFECIAHDTGFAVSSASDCHCKSNSNDNYAEVKNNFSYCRVQSTS